jgi:branched-chain amino acid transport system substrate-binding protein
VKVVSLDDGGNTSTGLTDAEQLAQQNHVIAVVGDFTSADTEVADYLGKQNIPYIGGLNLSSVADSADYFPSGGTQNALVYTALAVAHSHGARSVALPYCAEVVSCADKVPLVRAYGKQLGMPLVWSGEWSQSAPDYTPQCLAAKSSGASAMFTSAAPDAIIRFVASCTKQGFNPTEVNVDGTLSPQMLPIPAFQDMVTGQSNPNAASTATPALKAMHQAIAKYAPGTTFTSATVAAWAAAELFRAAYIAARAPSQATGTDILNGLYSLKGETMGGLSPPLTFKRGKPTEVYCAFAVGIANKQYSSPSGIADTCIPSSLRALGN